MTLSDGSPQYVALTKHPLHTVKWWWTGHLEFATQFPNMAAVNTFKKERMTHRQWINTGCRALTLDKATILDVMSS